jgi:hypothetical protein
MQAAPTDTPPSGRTFTPYRVVVVVILLGVAGLWIYALTRQPQPPPDRLDDAAFAIEAETICASTAAARDALPQAYQTDDPLERADVVDEANAQLSAMLTALRAEVPAAERDRGMLDEWLGDWDTYLDNRVDYAERLRGEGDARIYVAEKDGRQITVAIDRFAEVNDMLSCRTPKDIS